MTEELLANAYIKGASDLLQGKIDGMPKIIVVPEDATNGDMIKAVFPNLEIVDDFCHSIGVRLNNSNYVQFNKDWWNAPYESGVK